ncbi:YraN family protein [Oceanispirochaeta sp.]|jgi:putative endonuclease|uniref:YraN family protein n=1 Tax=Oceanispirochaeta sp. TaxID=2035350 RepID=UPI00261C186C|nr:YraN family protein [Oceanispirochaeta sp.]MDA3957890.1 YraN family protein [Oceanispirochaeta sp.]
MSVPKGEKNRDKIELGIKGECLAEEYLKDRGYEIVSRNERVGHSDIDILAREGEVLVFVEVRTKSDGDRGMPEETLTERKLIRMKKTAELYIAFHRYQGAARMDGICLILNKENEIHHFKHYRGIG